MFVRANEAFDVTPLTEAVTVYAPPVALAVKAGAVATPLESVFTCVVAPPPAKVPLAPLAGAVKVTVAPLTRFPPLSFTVAFKAVGKAVVTGALCGVPAVAMMLAGGPARLVREKAAGVEMPLTLAFTVYVPAVPLAVNTGAVATPLEFVVAVMVAPLFVPPANVPLAPLDGAVKVTVTPLAGFPPLSFTVTWSAVGNAVLIVTLCGVPAVAVIADGGPARLVRENEAGAATPFTVALTVKAPTVEFAVKTAAVATPLALVVAVIVAPLFVPPAKVPLAPVDGAMNVTTTPLSRLPPLSLTVTWRFVVKAVPIAMLCVAPAVAVAEAGAPARLVSENVAGELTPVTAAETL